MDASLQTRLDAARATVSTSRRRTSVPRTSTRAPASSVRPSPVRVTSSVRLTTAERRAETMRSIKSSSPSSAPHPTPRMSATKRSVTMPSPPSRASAARRAPASSAVTETASATPTRAPTPTQAPAMPNAKEIKGLNSVVVALQQQMAEFAKEKQAQDNKTAVLEQRVTELEQQTAHNCNCDQRLTAMADSVKEMVASLEDKLHGLEQDVSDRALDFYNLKAQVDALEMKARDTSYTLTSMKVQVKVVDAKLNRMSGRASLSPLPLPKIDPVQHEDRVRAIVAAVRDQAKNAHNRAASFDSHTSSVTGFKTSDVSQHSTASVSDRSVHEASDVSQYSFASLIDSQRSSEDSDNDTAFAPILTMDDLQTSHCTSSGVDLDASASADDRFARLEAMFRL